MVQLQRTAITHPQCIGDAEHVTKADTAPHSWTWPSAPKPWSQNSVDACTGLLIVASHQLQEIIIIIIIIRAFVRHTMSASELNLRWLCLLLGMLVNDDELINRISHSQATNYTSTVCYIWQTSEPAEEAELLLLTAATDIATLCVSGDWQWPTVTDWFLLYKQS